MFTGRTLLPAGDRSCCLSSNESGLFRFTVRHSVLMLTAVCLVTWLQANELSWMLPPAGRGTVAAGAVARAAGGQSGAIVG